MKLAISNIAWAPEDAETAYGMLADAGVRGLEIAPGILLHEADNPFTASEAECQAARERAQSFGLELCSMQSLLFGVERAELFGDHEARERFIGGISNSISLATKLGVPNLVLGSPKNRFIPESMTVEAARAIWIEAFRLLGDRAVDAGAAIALEPNPIAYGANFMTNLPDTIAVAAEVNHPGIKVNLDLGALIMTDALGETTRALRAHRALINHVHVSVQDLAPINGASDAVRRFITDLKAEDYDGWVSIEMRRDLSAVPEALRLCKEAIA